MFLFIGCWVLVWITCWRCGCNPRSLICRRSPITGTLWSWPNLQPRPRGRCELRTECTRVCTWGHIPSQIQWCPLVSLIFILWTDHFKDCLLAPFTKWWLIFLYCFQPQSITTTSFLTEASMFVDPSLVRPSLPDWGLLIVFKTGI